ncbi:MAG TPA: hypothetical protein VFM28_00095 [Nitrososphaeraceae archaeon]|nr:hypothetical protein [Nitrososphaeraceae archaeon]
MNRTNSLIIFASLLLGTFFVFNTTTMINVSAVEDKELSYYPPESPEYPVMNDYYPPEYNPAIYDNYESRYYEDRYGKPYYIE